MSLQRLDSPTAATDPVSSYHGFGPTPAFLTLPEGLPGSSVDVVGVTFTRVQIRKYTGLCLSSLSGPRAGRAIAFSVLDSREGATARFARRRFNVETRQSFIDRKQNSLVLADRAGIFAQVPARLGVGTERTVGLRHHLSMRTLA